MAKFAFNAGDEYALKLDRLATGADEIAKRAIYEAANIVADKIKSNLKSLPEESFRYLRNGEKLAGLPKGQKQDLVDSFGITSIDKDNDENWNARLGFDGYGSFPTKKYPQGLPNQLLARSVESGSSVRQKRPFVRPAVNATRAQARAKMKRVIDEEIMKTMGR